ncbi:pyruvate:ferredoxin (flavodoxin) oxidoreductase [Synechococcus sp. RedBA-s]|uniref:pyruvate:ferredoxin (flavodoxin) oxidoreductase n=1 Tax=Synechococcus sp. RedBA-s TaxID=2823741 RepID=UPI0020CC3DFF|nr:pyruvate:ferredoxin (flavodoxin) oxidoreductase [Synechococcus sp. RedBA-s]MCP9799621.1 pyruvate:ferredoxin (flavodoxin) oxidoreductase [Synechococcus sp. RedBA-s]
MTRATLDGNEAVARVAYRLNEVMAIYPITPASPMGEWADGWAGEGRPNLWGTVPRVVEMQSEGGAAGVLHGALQAGALTTTFTASQGLLLMLPNLYKIAGELTATVVHVASRALAGQALSIFGDHSDMMAVRGTGCVLLCSSSVQETGDFAAIASLASLRSRLPVVHFFDGFRTSHELQTVELIEDDLLRALIPAELIAAHRGRGLSPDHPVIRGTSQNPDVAFQAREAANPFHDAAAGLVQEAMDAFAGLSGRAYQLYEYHGHPQAERVLVLMGSGCETAHETVDALIGGGARVGVLKVRLYRPFAAERLLRALPVTTRAIAVLDRCKEPGSGGEPLYLDVSNALREGWAARVAADEVGGVAPLPRLLGGRYGLASKEFTPSMVRAVFAALERPGTPNPFTVGIDDDVTHRSLPLEDARDAGEGPDPGAAFAAILYGLGSDGTVGACKNTIKIIGAATALHAQGYFVYDSKKSGAVTVSHLRFGPEPIRSTYLVRQARLVACHHWDFFEHFDLLAEALPGATLLLNSPWPAEQLWPRLPRAVQEQIVERDLKVLAIEASAIAQELGLGERINTVMQVAFFAAAGVLPLEQALEGIRGAIRHSYGGKGERVVRSNLLAVDMALSRLRPMPIGTVGESALGAEREALPPPLASAPAWVRELIGPQLARQGDRLPVSALPPDGTFASGTARWEKRNIAESVPVWEADLCVQCGKCVMVCPHAAIRAKVVEPSTLADAPEGFVSTAARDPHWSGLSFSLQVAGEDCTGCGLCVEVCPARDRTEPRRKAINMAPQRPLRQKLRHHWDYALGLPSPDRRDLDLRHIRQQQLQEPLFEFSGACAGCGETPYIKLASQLFGDRMVVANATGCSSIYGGNLPTTPWSANGEGRGPAWSNSLFEDNAEFGLGFRLAFDQRRTIAEHQLRQLAAPAAAWLPAPLVEALIGADQTDEAGIHEQRQRVLELRALLQQRLEVDGSARAQCPDTEAARTLLSLADDLVKRSVWLIGGDGWAYDIGSAGIDHVLASGADVNILVLDTEVYSNTGGQMSKATPMGAVAKFASGGKATSKKDLGLMAMSYGHVYVASVAMGARDEQTLRAFLEAESFPGPSLILAYSHCIAHGIDMAQGMTQQKRAVDSGRWLLYRHDPRRAERGENPLVLDSRAPSLPMAEAMASENRFRMLTYSHPQQARDLTRQAQQEARQRWERYQRMAEP